MTRRDRLIEAILTGSITPVSRSVVATPLRTLAAIALMIGPAILASVLIEFVPWWIFAGVLVIDGVVLFHLGRRWEAEDEIEFGDRRDDDAAEHPSAEP